MDSIKHDLLEKANRRITGSHAATGPNHRTHTQLGKCVDEEKKHASLLYSSVTN